MPSRETPSIYAELLANIRQLSVAVTLPSPAGGHTHGLVTPDGATLQLQHAGAQTSFALPGRVHALPLPAPPPASRAISWRLPLAVDASGPSSSSPQPPATTARSPHDEPVPWTALDLAPGSAVACRGCAAPLVPPGRAGEWKDLPSENWAEMMDFWHCHKPTDHEHGGGEHDHLANRRGYGANSNIAAQPGVGMVDLTSFLFSESDCTGLEFSSSPSRGAGSGATSSAVLAGGPDPPPRVLHVFCAGCGAHAGFFNVATASVVLLKWQVSCRTASSSSSSPCAAPTSSECLAAALTATLSRSGSSKSVVVPAFQQSGGAAAAADAAPSPALHLWILNSRIAYASSRREGAGARSAIKLLYREIAQEEADAMLESMTSDVQEVNLPTAEIARAAEALRASSALLPPGERAFKEWNVGLLDKWEAGGGRERA